MVRAYENPLVSLNKALLYKPLFLRGYVRGGVGGPVMKQKLRFVCAGIFSSGCMFLGIFFVDVCFDATELHVSMASLKGQLGVPLTVYPWYLLCSLGILGDYNP